MIAPSLLSSQSVLRGRRLREWAIWWLAFALPLHGMSAVVTQWLGTQHYHRVAVASAAQRLHPHHHSAIERHRHQPADATVTAVGDAHGAAAADLDTAGDGWGLQQAPLTTGDAVVYDPLAQARATSQPWHVLRVDPERIERPPKS